MPSKPRTEKYTPKPPVNPSYPKPFVPSTRQPADHWGAAELAMKTR